MNFSNFLSKFFFIFVLLTGFNSYSQQQEVIKCTMNQRQILQSQSFNEDAIEAETAREVFKNFTDTLILAYSNINSNSMQELQVQISSIQQFLQTFQSLGLNYSMFNDDIEFILNYN